MTNYCPAIPVNTEYLLPLYPFNSFSSQRKWIEQEEKQNIITIGEQKFSSMNTQTVLMDIENTTLNKFLSEAVKYMEEYAPKELVSQALPYINKLNEKTTPYEIINFPPFSVSLPDDEEILLEWNLEHLKIGLSFDKNPEESGWYIVHDGTVKKMTAWGYLNSQSEEELADIILSQVIDDAVR